MQLARYRHADAIGIGVVQQGTLRVLPAWRSLVDLIEAGPEGLAQARAQAARPDAPTLPLHAVELLAPLDRLRRDVLCTGWNYHDHFTESIGKREGQEVPRPIAPTFFTKSPDVVIGPYDDIAYDPRVSRKWDYEAEIAVVIGKAGRSIPASRAMEHVWGYCLANDISQRDLQRRHGGQWLKGKSLDRSMPLGPWITTADSIHIEGVRLRCLLNGQTMQDAIAAQMAFPIAELIAELSLGMTLRPGDLLLTGTPSGIGNAREPPVFLTDGDEVIVQGEGLGELRNRLSHTDLYGSSSVNLAIA